MGQALNRGAGALQPVGLDIGRSTVKAIADQDRKVIFPSVYSKRLVKSAWDEKRKEVDLGVEGERGAEGAVIEAIGEKALEMMKHDGAIVIRPIIEGTVQHEAAIKLTQEAYRRLNIENPSSVVLVTGLPYNVSVSSINDLEKLLNESLGKPAQMAIYPQGFGSLIDCGLESATVINIGHSTTGLLLVEDLTVLGGGKESKATDYVVEQVRDSIIRDFGLVPSKETTRNLVISKEIRVGDTILIEKIDSIFDANTVVNRKDIEPALTNAVDFLCEKIEYEVAELHSQLPAMNLGCVKNIVLSGGFSMLQNPYSGEYMVRRAMEEKMRRPVVCPRDPLFSEATGYYKMAVELAET